MLAQPDVATPMGLRNCAMLETLDSTGIRLLELSRPTSTTWTPGAGP